MIRVQRGAPPESFATRAAAWDARFQAQNKTASAFWGDVRREMRTEAESLYQAFHGKCAFCESHMAHVAPAQIEHYKPKKHFPEAMFCWNNWLLSCGQCNTHKGQHKDFLEAHCAGRPCLIDPAHDDPSADLHFVRHKIFGDTERGDYTIHLIRLDRDPLNRERELWLHSINVLLLLTGVEAYRAQARNYLIWAMQDEAPYAAMTRCYLQQKAPRLADRPHAHIELDNAMTEISTLVEQYPDAIKELE